MYLASSNTRRELGLVALYSFPVMLIITFARRSGRSVEARGTEEQETSMVEPIEEKTMAEKKH